jgi:hypothetical protein
VSVDCVMSRACRFGAAAASDTTRIALRRSTEAQGLS